MYFNIIRRIKKYVIALLSMVVGFALAFMILGWKNKNAATFDDPLRGLVKALTMTIGELILMICMVLLKSIQLGYHLPKMT